MPTRLAGSKPRCRVEPLPGSSWARGSGRVQGPKPGSCIPGRERMQQGQTGGTKEGTFEVRGCPFPRAGCLEKTPPQFCCDPPPPFPVANWC